MKIENVIVNFLNKIEEENECWIWKGHKLEDGYGRFRVGNSLKLAHRFSHELLIGEVPEGHYVLHKCDNPPCVNPKHLFTGTQKDNMQDALQKMRVAYGEKVWNSKLTNEEGRQVRDLAKCGLFMQKEIGEWYGIKACTVANIKRGYRRGLT